MTEYEMSKSGHSLNVVEELALLALREDTGRPLVGWTQLQYGFAGAILAELALSGRIDLIDDRLHLISAEPVGDVECDRALEMFAAQRKNRRAGWWVQKIGGGKLRREVFDHLLEKGLVSDDSTKLFGIFPMLRLPETQPLLELHLRQRIQTALDRGTADDRTAAIIALAEVTGLRKKLFPDADKKTVKAILSNQWTGKAVKGVLDSITAGIAATVVVTSAS